MRIFVSEVPGFAGECRASWINRNVVCNRIDRGVTGFFRSIKRGWFGIPWRVGPEFHGIICADGVVRKPKPGGGA